MTMVNLSNDTEVQAAFTSYKSKQINKSEFKSSLFTKIYPYATKWHFYPDGTGFEVKTSSNDYLAYYAEN